MSRRESIARAGGVLLIDVGGSGGVSDYTGELARALSAIGWRVQLATARDHGFELPPEIAVHRVYAYVRGRRPAARLARRIGLARIVNGIAHLVGNALAARIARSCEIVHVQGEEWPPLGAALMLMLRAARRPMIYTMHNTFERGAHSYERTNNLIRRGAAAMIVHSENDLRSLPASQAAKTSVIPHGEYGRVATRSGPAPDRGACREQLGVGERELLALMFGQLRPDKGLSDLLRAAIDLPGLRIVAAGEDHGAVEEVAGLREDPRLRDRVSVMPGFVADETAARLFAACDLVALPYHRASASGVLLLAYGHARPVVIYPIGGLPEYVRAGETGWICARADPGALTEELRAIAAEGRAECARRGELAAHFAQEQLGWGAIARATASTYERTRRLA
ncbi:MAG TPA: glycosyltransferase family 4 protein [Solirubrobacteraceae bacterium]|jgi:glycosyltransferase involved in cell wall biosynthesis